MRLKFWKKKVTLSPIKQVKDRMDKVRITNATVIRANERMIREKKVWKHAGCSSSGPKTVDVSINYQGKTISQSITADKLRAAFAKSMKAVAHGSEL